MKTQTHKQPRLLVALRKAGLAHWHTDSNRTYDLREAYKGNRQQYGNAGRLRSAREHLKNSTRDPLRVSLRERLQIGNPLAILARLGKDNVGGLVSFELECKFDERRRGEIPLPLMAGRVHAEHDGIEIPVTCRWGDLTPLRKVCASLKALGATTNKTFGGHVHLDARDFLAGNTTAPASLKTRINTRLVPGVEKVLRWCVPHSRTANHYCKCLGASWNEHDRYRAVNVVALRKFGTVEIRLGSATLNPDKWRLWAEACLYFFRAPMEAAEIRAMRGITSAAAAADWIMSSNMRGPLKWWLLQRLRKFHPLAIPDISSGLDHEGGE